MNIQPKYKCGTKLYHLKRGKLEELVVAQVRIEVVLDENCVFAYNEVYYLQPSLGEKYWIDFADMADRYFKSKEELRKSIFG